VSLPVVKKERKKYACDILPYKHTRFFFIYELVGKKNVTMNKQNSEKKEIFYD